MAEIRAFHTMRTRLLSAFHQMEVHRLLLPLLDHRPPLPLVRHHRPLLVQALLLVAAQSHLIHLVAQCPVGVMSALQEIAAVSMDTVALLLPIVEMGALLHMEHAINMLYTSI